MTTRPVSRKSENSAKLTKAPVSSASARRLCKAALKRYGSLRKAAAALGLKSYGQLYAIMNGRMYDTPEMKAALRRADRRARRAWELVRDEGPKPRVDVEGLRGSIQAIEYQLRLMRELLKKSGIEVEFAPTQLADDIVKNCILTPHGEGLLDHLIAPAPIEPGAVPVES